MTRLAPAYLEELRRRSLLQDLVRRYGVALSTSGGGLLGLCPFHAERSASFYVWPDHFHCFGCGAHGDAIGFVMRANGLNFLAAVEKLAAEEQAPATVVITSQQSSPATLANSDDDRRHKRRRARRIWDQARDPRGTPVERYLASRLIELPPAPVLRWAPRCWHDLERRERPAMVAIVQAAAGEFLGIQRTYLRPDGSGKAELPRHWQKLSLGRCRGGAVRLAAPGDTPLIVAEGIETALSIIAATGRPCWAALGGIATAVLPAEIGAVVIYADNDPNGVGERAARCAAKRWAAEGRDVRIARQMRLKDANDLLRGGGGGDGKERPGRN